jgi:hypothetical protein
MYNVPKFANSSIKSVEVIEGEPIEHKIQRVLKNKEPIKDGAPIIYTEKKDGVISAYNIRTDRWEIATEAMDLVHRSKTAMADDKPQMEVNKSGDDEVSGAEPTQGTGNE